MRDWMKDNETESLRAIGEAIAKKREKIKMTQRDLAEKVGTTQTSIRRLEQGATNMSVVTLVRVFKLLSEEDKHEQRNFFGEPYAICASSEEDFDEQLMERMYKDLGELLLKPIENQKKIVDNVWDENEDYIKSTTSAMGLGEMDFYTKRSLLQLLGIWPK